MEFTKKSKSPPELSHNYYVLMWLCCCHPRSGKLNAASATQAQRFYTYRNPCEAIYTDMRRLTRIGVCVCVCVCAMQWMCKGPMNQGANVCSIL